MNKSTLPTAILTLLMASALAHSEDDGALKGLVDFDVRSASSGQAVAYADLDHPDDPTVALGSKIKRTRLAPRSGLSAGTHEKLACPVASAEQDSERVNVSA